MKYLILIKKGIKKQIGTILSITILLSLVFTSLIVSLTIYHSSSSYIDKELKRLGFGDITAWVSEVNNISNLKSEIEKIDDVGKVDFQELIYSPYSANSYHSDNEGQLIKYEEKYPYKIISNDKKGYEKITNLKLYDIYISPALASNWNLKVGDTIDFELTNDGNRQNFNIVGYFEDPFMGSSMIDMKSFLISEETFDVILNNLKNMNDINVLAKTGAMYHIFQDKDSNANLLELNKTITERTSIVNNIEFVYTSSTIHDFMMVLQNIFVGFLIVFSIVLFIVSMIVIANSITNTIDNDKKDLSILKTIGFTNTKLQLIELIKYSFSILLGFVISIMISAILIPKIAGMLTSFSGFILKINIPYHLCIILFSIIILFLLGVIILKLKKISKINMISILNGANEIKYDEIISNKIGKNNMLSGIAIRQIVSNKKAYIGTFIIAFVLSIFCLVIGRLDSWLGPNGEGLMNAFSVAKHDIGIQPYNHLDIERVQNEIREYADIVDVYSLAMQSVIVNGVEYTANVIDDPSWFHILKGRTVLIEDEIVITKMVSDNLNITIGDTVSVRRENQYRDYTVVGIYECANEMGANIGMSKEGYSRIGNVNAYIWCYHFLLSNHTHNEEIMNMLKNNYKLQMDIHTNSWSGLDSIVKVMNLLIIVMYLVVVIFIFIVIRLLTNKLLNIEKHDIGIYKSLGFNSNDLRVTFAIRIMIISLVGVILGMIMSIFFADGIILSILKWFGIGSFNSNISIINTLIPLLFLLCIFGLSALISSKNIKNVSLINLLQD